MNPRAVKVNSIDFRAYPAKVAGTSCLVFGWEVEGVDPWVLDALKHGAPMYTNNFIDMTCVLYAVYEQIYNKLRGGALEAVKNKVFKIDCAVQGNEFVVSVVCNHNAVVVKKVVSSVLKNISPGKMYLRYVTNVHKLDERPDKEAFYYCVNSINASIEKAVRIVLLGKVSVTEPKMKEILTAAVKKMHLTPAGGAGTRRAIAYEALASPYSAVNSGGGMGAVLYKKYLEQNLHVIPLMTGGKIYLPKKSAKKVPGLDAKEKIESFVDKFMKLGAQAQHGLLYLAGSECLMSTQTLISESTKQFAKPAFVGYISALLKHL
jgi:hypothetical protein